MPGRRENRHPLVGPVLVLNASRCPQEMWAQQLRSRGLASRAARALKAEALLRSTRILEDPRGSSRSVFSRNHLFSLLDTQVVLSELVVEGASRWDPGLSWAVTMRGPLGPTSDAMPTVQDAHEGAQVHSSPWPQIRCGNYAINERNSRLGSVKFLRARVAKGAPYQENAQFDGVLSME